MTAVTVGQEFLADKERLSPGGREELKKVVAEATRASADMLS